MSVEYTQNSLKAINEAKLYAKQREDAAAIAFVVLAENGQIATQYVDFKNEATGDARFNPNGSVYAIEGITSPDGRVLGKMGHSERKGAGLYKNVPGEFDMKLFESAVKYFK